LFSKLKSALSSIKMMSKSFGMS